MALPIQSAPSYHTKVPSTGQKISFRPFLVKEQKALLMAQQSEDQKTMISTLKNMISSCVLEEIDVNNLALFDLEYLFTQIRAKSVGEIVELIFSCDDCTDEKAKAKVSIDLTSIEVANSENVEKKIHLFDDVGVMMKYPNFDMLEEVGKVDNNDINNIFKIIVKCIDYIYNNEEIYYSKETSEEELLEFLNNLTQPQFEKIQEFFSKIPKMTSNVEYDCPICSKHHSKQIQGITSFF